MVGEKIGIRSIGSHIPRLRLQKDILGQAWGGGKLGGEKCVGNVDEDSITMAVGAGLECLDCLSSCPVDGLFFASTTAPYKEKQSSTVIATALDLARGVRTADFSNSLRSGSIALRAAIDALQAGSMKNVLVLASDSRLGLSGSEFDQLFGDGASALFLGTTELIATFEGFCTINDEFLDVWRTDSDRFVNSWEQRFVNENGYMRVMKDLAKEAFTQFQLRPDEISKVVLSAPEPRMHSRVARVLGFKEKQIVDPLFSQIGHTGGASVFIMLEAALENAKPKEKILMMNYGDGADAVLLETTDQILPWKDKARLSEKLKAKIPFSKLEEYLKTKNLVETEGLRRPLGSSSAPVLWREQEQLLRLHGHRCHSCSTLQYPLQRVCYKCGAKDNFESLRLPRRGKVFTYTIDYLAANLKSPTIMNVLDLEGGWRFFTQMTDCSPEKVRIDMPVELTLRRIPKESDFYNYFWFSRPLDKEI